MGNICYNDTGLAVDYIQSFLQTYYSRTVKLTGIYDKATHEALLAYLYKKNVKDINYVYNQLSENTDILRYFVSYKSVTSIIFYSKSGSDSIHEYMESAESDIKSIVAECGWTVETYQRYLVDNRFKIVVRANNFKNVIPTNDLLCFINLFNNNYKLDYIIQQNTILENPISNSINYKLALFECKPNTTYTICHAYKTIMNMTIACTSYAIKNLANAYCSKVESIYLGQNAKHEFTTDSDSNTLIIQLPYSKNINSSYDITIDMILGDVTLDGKVDEDDYNLLYSYLSGNTDLTDGQLTAANVTGHTDIKEVNYSDLNLIRTYIDTGTNGGIHKYTESVTESSSIINLLITENNNNKINYPYQEFNYSNKWSIHEKFLSYIYELAITEYSSEENIKYVQDKICSIFNINNMDKNGIYTDKLKDYVYSYQMYYCIPFALGYVDVETERHLIEDSDANKILPYTEWTRS